MKSSAFQTTVQPQIKNQHNSCFLHNKVLSIPDNSQHIHLQLRFGIQHSPIVYTVCKDKFNILKSTPKWDATECAQPCCHVRLLRYFQVQILTAVAATGNCNLLINSMTIRETQFNYFSAGNRMEQITILSLTSLLGCCTIMITGHFWQINFPSSRITMSFVLGEVIKSTKFSIFSRSDLMQVIFGNPVLKIPQWPFQLGNSVTCSLKTHCSSFCSRQSLWVLIKG